MHAYLHCLSHSPLVGYVDPAQEVLDEVNGVIASARERIAAFSPELVVLFAPDHYNGFFYDVMPPFCLGVGATAIGDFGSAAGELPVPVELAVMLVPAPLTERLPLRKRIGRKAHPHLPQFKQTARFAPGIRPGEIKQQIAIGFDPHIGPQFAIPHRHGTGRTGRRRIPNQIIIADPGNRFPTSGHGPGPYTQYNDPIFHTFQS